MKSPPKEKRGCYTALSKLRLLASYRTAALLATTFGWPFWLSEQWRGRLADQLQNEGLRP